MANFLTVLVLSCLAASCLAMAGNSRAKRQATNSGQCVQGDGYYPVDGNCQLFIHCENGQGWEKACPEGTSFDSNSRECARGVPGCPGNAADSLCGSNPGNPGEAWKVAHPQYCNFFLTCEEGSIHRRCGVCGEGTYFDEAVGFCLGMDVNNPPQQCVQKEVVPHDQVVLVLLSDECNLFESNPWRELLDSIRNGGGRVPVPNQRQFG